MMIMIEKERESRPRYITAIQSPLQNVKLKPTKPEIDQDRSKWYPFNQCQLYQPKTMIMIKKGKERPRYITVIQSPLQNIKLNPTKPEIDQDKSKRHPFTQYQLYQPKTMVIIKKK